MRLLFALFAAAILAAPLQGCLPVVAGGAGAGVLAIQERRTAGAFIDDEAIENKAASQIHQRDRKNEHINVTSYNRNVLISGEVPSEAVKTEIEQLVARIDNVHTIYNELVVSGVSSLVSRSDDALITSNVKLRFVRDDRFNADHVKVITENGTVFLMGLLTRSEGNAAAEVASTSKGVVRVVQLFEYIER